MLLALVGCDTKTGGGDSGDNTGGNNNTGGGNNAATTGDGSTRTITMGTWFDIYYTSAHNSIYDNPEVNDPFVAEMELENMRAIEEKHNIEFYTINLTWEGIQESIVTSILAGQPNCDIYMVDTQFGIPAVLNGLAISLESMGLAGTDVFEEQLVMKDLNVGQDETYLFRGSISSGIPLYPLAFNMNMVAEKGLENPQDLWDRGEWTWSVWRDYLIALTDTTNGIYGWSGYWTNMLEHLLFSNNAFIAPGPQTTITSPETVAVFDLIYQIYNNDRTGRPWDESEWTINNKLYAEGRSGFWIGADWIFQEFNGEGELTFDIGVVPWPLGPNADINNLKHGGTSGNWYMIPMYTNNPRQVYDVVFDWLNWYDYERELAENWEWSRNMYMSDRNFEYALMMNQNTGLDIYGDLGLGDSFSMVEIMNGEKTAAQYAEEVKQVVQDALDNFFT